MSGNEFAWEDEDIVLRSVSAIAVYSNPAGDVVIRQQDPMGDEDQVIVIPRDRVFMVADALHEEVAIQGPD